MWIPPPPPAPKRPQPDSDLRTTEAAGLQYKGPVLQRQKGGSPGAAGEVGLAGRHGRGETKGGDRRDEETLRHQCQYRRHTKAKGHLEPRAHQNQTKGHGCGSKFTSQGYAVLVFVSIYQGSILAHLFEPQDMAREKPQNLAPAPLSAASRLAAESSRGHQLGGPRDRLERCERGEPPPRAR